MHKKFQYHYKMQIQLLSTTERKIITNIQMNVANSNRNNYNKIIPNTCDAFIVKPS